jgi:hypothetical protein
LLEFRFILVIIDDEDSLGTHTVRSLDHARSFRAGIRQDFGSLLSHEMNRVLARQVIVGCL